MTVTFDDLVDDVLSEVAGWLARPRDIRNFGALSRRIYPLVAPFMYEELVFPDRENWEACLDTLLARPDLAKYVRRLELHAKRAQCPGKFPLSSALESLVPSMHNLAMFVCGVPSNWAMSASLWDTLRSRCPKLRTLGVAYVSCEEQLNWTSGFSRIRSLHIYFIPGAADPQEMVSQESRAQHRLRDAFPELEEIALLGSNTRPAEAAVHHLVSEHWPCLRKVTIGDIPVEAASPAQLDPGFHSPFFSFLEAHDIEELRLCGVSHLQPTAFTRLSRTALPHLRVFRGSIFQASTLTFRETHASLRSLEISEPLHLDEGIVGGVTQVLSHFRRITHLRIAFDCHVPTGREANLRSVLDTCPQLLELDLDLAITVYPFPTLEETVAMLKETLPLLIKLSIGLPSVHTSPLVASAFLFAAALPRLRDLQLRLFKPYQELLGQPPLPYQLGEYEVLRDAAGRPSVITHFEGRLVTDDRALRDAAGRLDVRGDPRPLRRRYWGSRGGWRCYVDVSQGELPVQTAFAHALRGWAGPGLRLRYALLSVLVPVLALLLRRVVE